MPNPERINIKDLTLEEPERKKGLPFDVERDLHPAFWDVATKQLKDHQERESWFNFATDAADLAILYPERIADLDLNETMWEKMKEELEIYKKEKVWGLGVSLAANMKILFPEKNMNNLIDMDSWRQIIQTFSSMKDIGSLRDSIVFASEVKILNPERFKDLELDEEKTWDEIETLLDRYRNVNIDVFAKIARQVRIVFPEKFYSLNLDAAMWEKMMKLFRKQEILDPLLDPRHIQFTASLKLLAAEEIKITDKGLEIIMSKEKPEFKEETPPMPQTRKF